jgi:hypothetical protein
MMACQERRDRQLDLAMAKGTLQTGHLHGMANSADHTPRYSSSEAHSGQLGASPPHDRRPGRLIEPTVGAVRWCEHRVLRVFPLMASPELFFSLFERASRAARMDGVF